MFCRIVRTRLKNSCTSPISIINSNRNDVWTSPGFQKNGGCLNEWLYVASLALSTKNPSLHAVCCNFIGLGIRKCLKSRGTHQKCHGIPNTLSAALTCVFRENTFAKILRRGLFAGQHDLWTREIAHFYDTTHKIWFRYFSFMLVNDKFTLRSHLVMNGKIRLRSRTHNRKTITNH